MKKLKAFFHGGISLVDRVLFGTRAGKVLITAALISLGVPAIEAVPIADVLNAALDAVGPQ